MSHHEGQSGSLPTEAVTTQQTVVLVQSLLVTWKVLDHLKDKGVVGSGRKASGPEDLVRREDAGCCKPDAGPCCVNKK
jgi:hypothetical protein